MKKVFNIIFIFVVLFSLSFVLASNGNWQVNRTNFTEGNATTMKAVGNATQYAVGNIIRNRVKAGNYISSSGKRIMVKELAQNRRRLVVGNVSADCSKCNLTGEYDPVQNRTKLRIALSNGRNSEIKIMPDRASKIALARLRLKVCNETNNCTIELKEIGQGNKTKAKYEMQVERHYKILGLFRAKARERIEIDSETGKIVGQRRAWWRFLARTQED